MRRPHCVLAAERIKLLKFKKTLKFRNQIGQIISLVQVMLIILHIIALMLIVVHVNIDFKDIFVCVFNCVHSPCDVQRFLKQIQLRTSLSVSQVVSVKDYSLRRTVENEPWCLLDRSSLAGKKIS